MQVKRAETEKAARVGEREAARTVLRREVRAAAAGATGEEAFFDRLREAGVLVRVRYSERNPDQVTGLAVAWPSQLTAAGQPVFYSGGKLGPDLTWPHLSSRWTNNTTPDIGRLSAGQIVDGITNRFTTFTAGETADVITATGDVLNAVARRAEGIRGVGPHHESAARYQRSVRDPEDRRPAPSAGGGELRAIARMLAVSPRTPATDLVVALLRLLDIIGQHRTDQGRMVQADAVMAAKQHLTASPVPPVSVAAQSATLQAWVATTTQPGLRR